MKRLLCLLLSILCLVGCSADKAEVSRYEATFLELFDTVTTILGYAESEAAFQETATEIHDALQEYHQLYDIYHDYEGIHNIKTINDNAGTPVTVDQRIIDLLKTAKTLYETTGGRVNVAMGSVLTLWHDAREYAVENPLEATLPEDGAIQEALQHIDFNKVVIDEEHSTVCLTDPAMRLDVGAIAKGYAAEQVAKTLPPHMMLSVGGNVRATGEKLDGSPWVVGVENPDGGNYLKKLAVTSEAVVTSGDYQRYFTVNGKAYHHIIDPDTGYPSDYFRAVTVICPDSGVADGLSTALFTLSEEEGNALLSQYDAKALWIYPDGTIHMSDGFAAYLQD